MIRPQRAGSACQKRRGAAAHRSVAPLDFGSFIDPPLAGELRAFPVSTLVAEPGSGRAPYPAHFATASRRLGRSPTSRTVPRALFSCLGLCLAVFLIRYHITQACQQTFEKLSGTMAQKKTPQTQASGSAGSSSATGYLDLRGSYVPIFSGRSLRTDHVVS